MTMAVPSKDVVKAESFILTQNDITTSRDIGPDYNKLEFQDLWRFQIPVGVAYIFEPGMTFSLYMEYLVDTFDVALLDDGGVFTDDTTDLNDAGTADVALMPATEVENDAFYFGKYYPFGQIGLDLGTVGVGTTGIWEYPTAQGTWATIPGTTDGTTLLTVSGTLAFQPPANWLRTTVDGKSAYWIRFRVTASPDYTTVPVGDQGWVNGSAAGAGVQIRNSELLRVEVRDPSEEQRYHVIPTARYAQVKEFQDRHLIYKLPISRPIIARERYWLVIQGRPISGIFDVSNGYFNLQSKRLRKPIYTA